VTGQSEPPSGAANPPDDETSPTQNSGPATPRLSPVRPQDPPGSLPDDSEPRVPLRPIKPATGPLGDETAPDLTSLTGADSDPQGALERLRRQLSRVAQEFADGNINRAQFNAIYNRYSEQRRIIEGILSHDPGSQAWQQVARPGHTGFLRQYYEAHLLFYGVYPLGVTDPILDHGTFMEPEHCLPVLRGLPSLLEQRGALKPARRKIGEDGHWMVVVPGAFTVSLALFSLEPAERQFEQIADLHYDFERANIHVLTRGDFTPDRLVFPQRGLFLD
jgi:hypothetical protein